MGNRNALLNDRADKKKESQIFVRSGQEKL